MVMPKYVKKEYLEKAFEYIDGQLWRKDRTDSRGQKLPKKIVENKKNVRTGYCFVRFGYRKIAYHTIVWILNKGDIGTTLFIDHINGDKLDNRIENLRLVTNRENCQNKRIHRSGKLPGCYLDRRRNIWYAETRINGKKIFIGGFKTQEEANKAYTDYLKGDCNDMSTDVSNLSCKRA